MALDTRDRRASAIGVGLPQGVAQAFEHPEVYTDTEDNRQHMAHWYAVVLGTLPSLGTWHGHASPWLRMQRRSRRKR